MARQLRITDPGMWHHVMNRGTDHGAIFTCDADREDFLGLLAECGPRFDVWPACFALPDNHYHAEVFDVRGNLSRAMKHLDGVFTQRFNRRHGRDGPLMRGRFKSKVIGGERYLVRVARYIHHHAPGDGDARSLAAYRWSSHRFYVGAESPDWLRTDLLLRFFGGTDAEARRAFEAFVVDGPNDFPETSWYVGGDSVVGDLDFIEECRARVRRRPDDRAGPNVPEGRRLAAPTVDEVIQAVAIVEGVAPWILTRRSRRAGHVRLRRRVLWACVELTGRSQTAVAGRFGVAPTTVWRACVDARERPGAMAFIDAVSARLDDGRSEHDRAAE